MLILTSCPDLENDRWTVETSFIFNVNFHNQISFEKFVDSFHLCRETQLKTTHAHLLLVVFVEMNCFLRNRSLEFREI